MARTLALALALMVLMPSAVRAAPAAQEAAKASAASGDTGESDSKASPVPGVTVDEHVGDRLPDLPFVNEKGERVTLHQYLGTKKPIILTLNYYRCPMLCDLVLNGLGQAVAELELTPGEDYEIVTVSIDPAEMPKLAQMKKQSYIKKIDRPGLEQGWHFLTGEKHNLDALAETVGYGYAWVESKKQYAHPAVITLIKPDGTIFRYLYGIQFDPDLLRLSQVEASDGQIGSTADQILLTCFSFDPDSGSYTWAAMAMMRIGGALTAGLLAIIIAGFLVWEYVHRQGPAEVLPDDAADERG